MSDSEDTRRLVLAIMDFLQTELVTRENLSLEDRDSLEMAVECLEMAYELENHEYIQRRSLLDMFTQVSNPVSIRDKLRADDLKRNGNNKMSQELYQEADEDYSRAIELDRWNAIYYCNRAGARTKLARYLEAILDCRQAITLNPDYAKAYERMGEAYTLMERPRRAVRCFRQALELEPENERYQNNLRVAESQAAEVGENGLNNLITSILASVLGAGLPQTGNGGFPEPGNGGNNIRVAESQAVEVGENGLNNLITSILASVLGAGLPQTGNGGFPEPGNGGQPLMGLPSTFMIIADPHSSQECDGFRSSSLSTITEISEQSDVSGIEDSSNQVVANGSTEVSSDQPPNEGNPETLNDDTIHIRLLLGIPTLIRTDGSNVPPVSVPNQVLPFGGLESRNTVETDNNRNGHQGTVKGKLAVRISENRNQSATNFTYSQETDKAKVNKTKGNENRPPTGLFKDISKNNVTAKQNGGAQQSPKEAKDSRHSESTRGTEEESFYEKPQEQKSETLSPFFNVKDISNFFKNLGKNDSSKVNGSGEKDQVKEERSEETDIKAEEKNEQTKDNSPDSSQGLFSFFTRQKTPNPNSNDKSELSEKNEFSTSDGSQEEEGHKTEKK